MKPLGHCFDHFWKISCSVQPAARSEVDWMIRKHYIGKWPGVCVAILGMRCGIEPVGVAVFALPPPETSKRYGGETWELARVWIDDAIPANGETWLMARAVRHVKANHPLVKVLVSYANPDAGHAGTIYRAANWIADGRTDDDRKSPRCDYVADGVRYSRRSHIPAGAVIERVPRTSKHRFIYRL